MLNIDFASSTRHYVAISLGVHCNNRTARRRNGPLPYVQVSLTFVTDPFITYDTNIGGRSSLKPKFMHSMKLAVIINTQTSFHPFTSRLAIKPYNNHDTLPTPASTLNAHSRAPNTHHNNPSVFHAPSSSKYPYHSSHSSYCDCPPYSYFRADSPPLV